MGEGPKLNNQCITDMTNTGGTETRGLAPKHAGGGREFCGELSHLQWRHLGASPHHPINLMMCTVANLSYILLSSDGADTNNNDECASATVADGSSARAAENECVALLNHGRTNERRSNST
eukprot:scaffold249355_cov64-Cyclotella_meneghiniana.AAC.1